VTEEALTFEGLIGGDTALEQLYGIVKARMATDPAHDLGHLCRVAVWTARLGAPEGVPARLAVAAALLHDVVNVPKGHPDRAKASALSADVAREVLPPLGFTPGEVEDVAGAVRDHSFTRGAVPASALGRVLQDADQLEALGALGVFRCLVTGAALGAEFFDADDPWAARRALDDRRFSLDHFFVKLLRLPETLHTDAGRAEARRRVRTMHAFLHALGDEIGHPAPAAVTAG
jgi:uncharacterized protein